MALDDLLKQANPGVNPELEAMISRLMLGAGSSADRAAKATAPTAPAPGTLGTGAAGAPPAGAGAAPMPPQIPEAANQTYMVLVKQGVPPEIAKQAIANPALLRQLLAKLYSQSGPQELPQQMDSSAAAARQSSPPLGGGGSA